MSLSKYRNKVILVLLDMLALVLSGMIGLVLRFDSIHSSGHLSTWGRYLLIGIPLYFVIYFYFGLYSRIWRYASAFDLFAIASAVTVATGCLFGVMYVNPEITFPKSVLVMTWFMNVAAVGGIRFLLRLITDIRKKKQSNGRKRALILGAGDAGRMLVEEIARHPELDYKPVGFLDDDKRKIGFKVAGLPVLGSLALLEEIILAQGVSDVIIAMPSAPNTRIKELVQKCTNISIKPRIVPGLFRVLKTGIQLSGIREVQIEDLLPRPEIKMDQFGISEYIRDKTVLVTGAGGSIGSELSRQVATFGASTVLLLGHGENSIYLIHKELARSHPNLNLVPVIADVQDRARITQVFSEYNPQVVFHAAAHKHVPLMEYNPAEALKNNVFGTKNVAEAAEAHGVDRFVLISTDKAVNPTSVMGATKRMAELVIQSINQRSSTKFMAVRFGNVLGSRGSVIPLFKEQIAQGGPVTVTHPEMTRYFMTIPEAVSLVIQAGALGLGGEVFVLDMGEPVKIVDLAQDLITLSGFKPNEDIRIEYTGMRPGEKLFEELLTSDEGTLATRHERIFTARQSALQASIIEEALVHIASLRDQGCMPTQVLEIVATLDRHALSEAAAAQQSGL